MGVLAAGILDGGSSSTAGWTSGKVKEIEGGVAGG